MSDYRNMDWDFLNPEDPYRRDAKLNLDAGASNAAWRGIAAVAFVLAILAIGFGIWAKPSQNGMSTAPAVTHMAPTAPTAPGSVENGR